MGLEGGVEGGGEGGMRIEGGGGREERERDKGGLNRNARVLTVH